MRGSNGPKRARSGSMEHSSNGTGSNGSSHNNTNGTSAGSANNMSSNDAGTTPTPTAQPGSTTETPPRDAALEEQMERLEVDEDFKVSLRSMSPNSRREVMEDVMRTQHAERAYRSFRLAAQLGSARFSSQPDGSLETGTGVTDDSNDEETDLPMPSHLLMATGISPYDALLHPVMFGLQGMERIQFARAPGEDYIDFMSVIGELVARRNLGITQDIDDMSYEQLLDLQERIGYVSKGITREQMRECVRDVGRPSEGACVFCQGEWHEGDVGSDKAVELKTCHHVFHRACIEQWLGSNKTCPVCKRDVV